MSKLQASFFISVGMLIGLLAGWVCEQIETHFMTKHIDAAIKARKARDQGQQEKAS
jgi:sorbitol-specific phosphotransferase system component IIC